MWFPQLHQTYINKRNPNYLNSVFIGFTVPILNLWSIVLPEFLSLLKGLISCAAAILIFPVIGLLGFANAKNVTSQERNFESIIASLSEDEITVEEFRESPEKYINQAAEKFKNRLRLLIQENDDSD